MAKTEALHDRGMVVVKLRSPATTVKDELASAEARRALMGEFLGSLLFVVLGAGTVAITAGMLAERLDSARMLVIALAHPPAPSATSAPTASRCGSRSAAASRRRSW